MVGRFDANAGVFSGHRKEVVREPAVLLPGGKLPRTPPDRRSPSIEQRQGTITQGRLNRIRYSGRWQIFATVPSLDVAYVNLRFEIANAGGRPVAVTLGQETKQLAPGETSVDFAIRQGGLLHWKISAGGRGVADEIEIRRPEIIGIGAFKVPALPVTIVYQPPVGKYITTEATYARSSLLRTTTGQSFTTTESTTRGAAPSDPRLAGLAETKSDLRNMATVASTLPRIFPSVPTAVAAAVANGLSRLADGLGSVQARQTNVKSDVQENRWTLTLVGSESLSNPGGSLRRAGQGR